MERADEESIIEECRNGNWGKFDQIYDHYLPKIYRYIYYRIGHKQTAEDLSSAVFLKIVQGLHTYRSEQGVFATWGYRISRNTLIDHQRARKPTADLQEAWDVASAENVELQADAAVKIESVKQMIKQLPPDVQEIVKMRVWDELSHKEIAEILDISEENSKTIFSRALASLKQAINQSHDPANRS